MAGAHTRMGEVTIDEELYDVGTLRRALLEKFEAPDYKPPILPGVALDLHRMARDPSVDIAKIVKVAEKEPLLCASVIRRGQSALYGGAKVQSIQQAIVRLGLSEVSNMFLEFAMSARVFRAKGYEAPMESLRKHSVATAHAATRVARRTSLFDEYAFLCGLLHDVGIAAGMIAVAENVRPDRLPGFYEAWPALYDVHEEAAQALCRIWKLPPDVAIVIAHHHASHIGGVVHPLGAVVAIAQFEASQGEMPYGFSEPVEDPVWARKALGLTGMDLPLRAEIQDALRLVE